MVRSLPDGSIEFQNRTLLDYATITPEQTGWHEWKAAVHSGDLDRFADRWTEILATKAPGEIDALAKATISIG
jgi:hypothetical protein